MLWIFDAAVSAAGFYWMFRIRRELIDGSMVMAAGILVSGMLQSVPYLNRAAGPLLTILLLIMLVRLIGEEARELRQVSGTGRLSHPVGSFLKGTLIAAISVAIADIGLELPLIRPAAYALFVLNGILWILYLALAVRNYSAILRDRTVRGELHGVVLLVCVATQSIVISGTALFGSRFPAWLSVGLIALGASAYIAGLILIGWRYFSGGCIDWATQWTNANCIIHGAASITGLAGAVSHAVPVDAEWGIWLWALAAFVPVEICELVRGWSRVRKFGWRKGVFTYSVTQWARNFTFGMLLAFTLHLRPASGIAGTANWAWLNDLRDTVIGIGIPLVALLFLLEIALLAAESAAKGWSSPAVSRRHTGTPHSG
jgi:hypothetical protein